MSEFCSCLEWKEVSKNNLSIFKQDPTYGWVLHWIELLEVEGYTQVQRYGVEIKFCPMCGRRLN